MAARPTAPRRTCSISGCDGKHLARSFCRKHYQRFQKHGDPHHTIRVDGCKVSDCDKPHFGLGLCSKHYNRLRRHGNTTPPRSEPGEALQWLRDVPETDNCIPWPFQRDQNGYGLTKYQGRTSSAHRVSLLIHVGGPPQRGLVACHAPVVCHNPSCVNPRHLMWGTYKRNSSHRALDGTYGIALDEHRVGRIKSMLGAGVIQKTIAERFGVSVGTICKINRGKSWAHIPASPPPSPKH